MHNNVCVGRYVHGQSGVHHAIEDWARERYAERAQLDLAPMLADSPMRQTPAWYFTDPKCLAMR